MYGSKASPRSDERKQLYVPREAFQKESMKILFISAAAILIALVSYGCKSPPKPFNGINGFDKSRYLGKWFEIARFDISFEKDLMNTTADYSVGKNGFLRVVNKGYNYKKMKWEQAIGKARFVGSDTVGELDVSFFGPFYGAYNVIALDKDYQYALIAGSSTKYMWILSRTKTIPAEVRREYIQIAKASGFETDKLIWVKQDGSSSTTED